MKRTWAIAAAAVASVTLAAPASAADIGVSIQISQPGVYGRVDIGRYPQPEVWTRQPILVAQPMRPVPVQPVYMWVPPHERADWRRYCAYYGACAIPVYFVEDRWYDRVVRPHAHNRPPQHPQWYGPPGKAHPPGKADPPPKPHPPGKAHGHDKRPGPKHDRRDDRRDDRRGPDRRP